MALILDIETYKDLSDKKFLEYKMEKITAPSNYKDQSKIDAYIEEKKVESQKKLALSPFTAQVITVGFKSDFDEPKVLFNVSECQPNIEPSLIFYQSEKELLTEAFKIINAFIDNGTTLVTFNGKAFDLPFLFTRAIINQIEEPLRDYPELIHNYRHDKHLDLCSFFDKGSLNSLAYLTGVGNLYDEKGDSIDKHYTNKDYFSILEKIQKDLYKTSAIYGKIKNWIPQRQSYY